MKKLILGIAVLFVSITSAAQNPVIRGEVSPGVYTNVAVDASGNLVTSSSSSGATTGSKTGGTAASMSSLVGGIYQNSPSTLTSGQQTAIQLGSTGSVKVQLLGSDSNASINAIAGDSNGIGTGLNSLVVSTYNRVFNGTTWDRQMGNSTGTFVVARPTPGTFTDRSGTFAAASVSQQVMPVNANRRYLMIQNTGDAIFWCNFTAAATLAQPSISLSPGASFTLETNSITTEAVNCISATISKPFTAKEM